MSSEEGWERHYRGLGLALGKDVNLRNKQSISRVKPVLMGFKGFRVQTPRGVLWGVDGCNETSGE